MRRSVRTWSGPTRFTLHVRRFTRPPAAPGHGARATGHGMSLRAELGNLSSLLATEHTEASEKGRAGSRRVVAERSERRRKKAPTAKDSHHAGQAGGPERATAVGWAPLTVFLKRDCLSPSRKGREEGRNDDPVYPWRSWRLCERPVLPQRVTSDEGRATISTAKHANDAKGTAFEPRVTGHVPRDVIASGARQSPASTRPRHSASTNDASRGLRPPPRATAKVPRAGDPCPPLSFGPTVPPRRPAAPGHGPRDTALDIPLPPHHNCLPEVKQGRHSPPYVLAYQCERRVPRDEPVPWPEVGPAR